MRGCRLDKNASEETKHTILQPYYAFGSELSIPLNIGKALGSVLGAPGDWREVVSVSLMR